jgi:hypothetical protein
MTPQGEKTVYETVPLLGKFCLLLSRGLAELHGEEKVANWTQRRACAMIAARKFA